MPRFALMLAAAAMALAACGEEKKEPPPMELGPDTAQLQSGRA